MIERVMFRPKRMCSCRLVRTGNAGAIMHGEPCKHQGVEWLAQSGEPIICGKRYRWVQGDDDWSRERGYPEINVVAEVLKVNGTGMIFAQWNENRPPPNQRNEVTSIPNSAVVERVPPDDLPQAL